MKFDKKKLDILDEKIQNHDSQNIDSHSSKKNDGEFSNNMSQAKKNMHIGLEFLSAIVVSVFIGYTLDNFFDTKPWVMIGMFFVGFAAGLMNIMRILKKMS